MNRKDTKKTLFFLMFSTNKVFKMPLKMCLAVTVDQNVKNYSYLHIQIFQVKTNIQKYWLKPLI